MSEEKNAQFIITIVDPEEQSFDRSELRFDQPFTILRYLTKEAEDGSVNSTLGLSHHNLTATLEGQPEEETPVMSVGEVIPPVTNLIADEWPSMQALHSIAGLEVLDDEDFPNASLYYNTSMQIIDTIAKEFDNEILADSDTGDKDLHRVVRFVKDSINGSLEDSHMTIMGTILFPKESEEINLNV